MSNESVTKYKEMQKRLTLMNDAEWIRSISQLKGFKPEADINYSVVYKQDKQRNDRSFNFDAVTYVEETNSFIFVSYVSDFQTGDLTEEVKSRLVLSDTEIISIRFEKKFKASDYFYFN